MTIVEVEEGSTSVEQITNDLIEKSGLDANDIDSATSGLCATFALTLYRELVKRYIPCQIVFICKIDMRGNPLYIEGYKGQTKYLYWRHAAVKVGNNYFDVEGKVELDHMIKNYCWGWVRGSRDGGIAVPVSVSDAISIIRNTENAYDWRHRNKWKKQLKIVESFLNFLS